MSEGTDQELGPLAGLSGVWEGAKGTDTAPDDDPTQTEINAYRGRNTFDPTGLAEKLAYLELKDEDKAALRRPEILELFRVDFPEAYRQNGIGSAYDVTIPANWPIPLQEIRTKVRLWQAERDPLVGNMTLYLASRIPDAELQRLPGEGHLWILDHMPEVLETLMNE